MRALSREYLLERIWVIARIPCLCSYCHRCGREVLHLLEMEVELLCRDGQLGHVPSPASRVAAYEVRDNLLSQSLFPAYPVEYCLELSEKAERGFPHQAQDIGRCVLGRHLQSAADMPCYQLAGVCGRRGVCLLVGRVVEEQVIAYAGADEALLDPWYGVDGTVEGCEAAMVSIEIGAYGRMDARRPLACVTRAHVLAVHGIHVCRWASKVREIAFEIGHGDDPPHLIKYALCRAAGDKLPLMG